MYTLFLCSSPDWLKKQLVHIGSTSNPAITRAELADLHPPLLSSRLDYITVWETTAATRDELYDHVEVVHQRFFRYRMMDRIPGDSEWFNMGGVLTLEVIETFIDSCPWVKRRVPLEELNAAHAM